MKRTKFYYANFDITSEDYTFNIIFSQGDSGHQTIDITDLNKDTYFEIATTTNKYTVNDITDKFKDNPYDINNDGVVDVSDVSLMIDVVLGINAADALYVKCDLNGDHHVDVSDVSLLIDAILGLWLLLPSFIWLTWTLIGANRWGFNSFLTLMLLFICCFIIKLRFNVLWQAMVKGVVLILRFVTIKAEKSFVFVYDFP